MAREQYPYALSWAALLALSACAGPRTQPPVPAVLVNPSEQDRIELSRMVGGALGGAPVLLAPDALTMDSVLIIEPVRPRDAAGLPLEGRELRSPERFRLELTGSRCVLIHERTDRRWTLTQPCRPR
jgi:hypothetical protein